jgi:hypothetical protein
VSNALAIASVTAVMKNLLDNGLIDDHVIGALGHVHVTALAPDLIPLEKNAESQLNLFLYMVTPNAAWRNDGLPSRDAVGDRRTNPPLALDLHYLLTAYASKDLHAEILLGYAMQLLHETAVLPRAGIRRALSVPGLVDDPGGALPPELEALTTSGLAEQVELIKITPDSVGPEELAKLWAGFQSRYRPSAGYRASVVLIEAQESTRAALPVRVRRGYVVPFEQPVIDRVLAEDTIGGPITPGTQVLARRRLVLRGRGLRGDATLVRVGDQAVAPDPTLVSDTQIIVALPDGLKAGIQSAQVIHEQLMGEPPVPHFGVASNLAPFVLHPEIVAPIAKPSAGVLRVSVDPPVQEGQRVVLLLNEQVFPASPPSATRPRAYSFVPPLSALISPGGPIRDVDVPYRGVVPGPYLVRLSVDGADSPLDTDPLSGAYNAPAVTLS